MVRGYDAEVSAAQRYVEKSYDLATVPGTSTGMGASIEDFYSTGGAPARVRFAVSKLGIASVTVYDAVGNAGRVTTEAVNNNITPIAVDNVGQSGFKVFHNPSTRVSFHWLAVSDL